MGLLLLVAFSMAGATHAWFIAQPVEGNSIFEAGTVFISEPVLQSRNSYTEPVCWEFTNVGSKKSYVRVRLEGSGVRGESAWSDGVTGFQISYFIFTRGTIETNEITVGFIQNPVRRFKIGEITTWNDDSNLYIKLNTSVSGGLMQYSKYHTTLSPNVKGHDGWAQEYAHAENERYIYIYAIPLENVTFGDISFGSQTYSNSTYIAVHSVFDRPTESSTGELFWNLAGDSVNQWQWIDKQANEAYGWFYYKDNIVSGQTIRVCFEADAAEYVDVKLIAEAVQASHEAVFEMWGVGLLLADPYNINNNGWHRVNKANNLWQMTVNGDFYNWQILNPSDDVNIKGWVKN